MAYVDFAYAPASDAAGLPISVTILADRDEVRAHWCEFADMAGWRIAHFGGFESVADDTVRALGDIVLVDCRAVSGTVLAALARLDMRVARSGAELLVSASQEAIEPVFGCLAQSPVHWLVDPGEGERAGVLADLMARKPRSRLRDLSDPDRLALLRLTEQVVEIADRLERLGQKGFGSDGGAFRFESPTDGFKREDGSGRKLVRKPRPPLPDPRLVRRIIQQRQLRARFFDSELFADPAWDILLDLTAARAEHQRVSVTSLCIASGVPPTTALRWIGQMVEAGLLERVEDEADRRRAFITLSDRAADAMARYFAELDKDAKSIS